MNVDVETIASKKTNLIPIYKFIENSYFEAKKLFPTKQKNQCSNNKNNPQNIPNEIKADLKNGYGTGVVCTSGNDHLKGVR